MSSYGSAQPRGSDSKTVRAEVPDPVKSAGVGESDPHRQRARGTGRSAGGVGLTRNTHSYTLGLQAPPNRSSAKEVIQVKGIVPFHDEVDGSAEFMSQDRQRLTLAVFLGQASDIVLGPLALAQQQHGGFAEGPLQVTVTDTGTAIAQFLAGRGMDTLHQPAVGAELLYRGKPVDILHLIEDGQSQDVADARDALEPVECTRVEPFGMAEDIVLQGGDLAVELIHDGDVGFDIEPDMGISKAFHQVLAVALLANVFLEWRQVVLVVGDRDMALQLTPQPNQVGASAHQVADRPIVGRIHIGLGEVTAQQHACQLL